MEEKKTNKGLIIGIIAAIAIIVAIVVILVINLGKKDSYRIIKIYELEGEAIVTRAQIGEIEAYSNMVLESGDKIKFISGKLTLKLDDDKYVYVEENTEFEIIATGSREDSKTTINLTKGGITNEIQNKLSDDSSYEVNTPNSNMAVRGTIFSVFVYEEGNILYTRNVVFDGKVASRLKYKDGSYSDDTVIVPGGKEVLIYEDETTTDYVSGIVDIDFETLPDNVKVVVFVILGEDAESLFEKQGPFTVTFKFNGNVFGTQIVDKGECAKIPTLMPQESGSWDFDFTTPINDDTEINWR